MIRKALYQFPRDDGRVRCGLCPNGCLIVPQGRGLCGTRENIGGVLYALNDGVAACEALDPIEKKPLYHFLPGTMTYSLGTFGCNFFCAHCQNHDISRTADENLSNGADIHLIGMRPARYQELTPEEAVSRARLSGAESISFTYNEPSVWYEFVLNTAKAAKAAGLLTVLVTNGFISDAPLRALLPFIDAYRLDVKAFDPQTYEKISGTKNRPLETVLHSAVLAKEAGCHIEIVTLLIPGRNDDMNTLKDEFDWIVRFLGNGTPVHLTAYHPAHLSQAPPTPAGLLKDAAALAKKSGLCHVYIGNADAGPFSDTYCPTCGAVLIRRNGFCADLSGIEKNECERRVCRNCGRSVDTYLFLSDE